VAIIPPVWMLARTCMPGRTVFDLVMRALAVAMAFMTGVVLSMLDSTSNDLMAAMPLVWALALALEPLNTDRPDWLKPNRAVVISGLLTGAAVAFKLSNGPLAIVVMPVLWLLATGGGVKSGLLHAVAGGVATLVGFGLIYSYWGAQLWAHFGNPVYPFHDDFFAQLRALTGWTP
jgi:hypothetical protein